MKPIGEGRALMPTQGKNLWPSALIVTHRNFHKRAVETNAHVCIYLIIGKGQIAQKTILGNLVEPLSRKSRVKHSNELVQDACARRLYRWCRLNSPRINIVTSTSSILLLPLESNSLPALSMLRNSSFTERHPAHILLILQSGRNPSVKVAQAESF